MFLDEVFSAWCSARPYSWNKFLTLYKHCAKTNFPQELKQCLKLVLNYALTTLVFLKHIKILKKSYFYELWQQHKQLETMEMSETWRDSFDERYIAKPIPTWTYSQNSLAAAAEALSLKISSHGTSLKWSWRPSSNHHENSHKQCDETRCYILY